MNVLIIEDEEMAADRLQRLLRQIDPTIKIAGATESLQQPAPAPDYHELLQALSGKTTSYQKRIVIRFGHNIRIIEICEVAYFYTEEKVTLACTIEGKRWPVDHNLDELEHMLDPTQFFRINRQFIINIQAIDSMHSYSKARVKIELKPASDMDTIVSTERSANFKQWLLGK